MSSAGIYVTNFNNSHFEPVNNINLMNTNQWIHGGAIVITESGGVMKISSNNKVSGSYPLLNSKGFDVHVNETILLSLYASYANTIQSSLRIIGNTSNGQLVLGYAFIVDGNSTWHYYSLKVTIPGDVTSIFIQVPLGSVISSAEPEVIMLKEMLIYNVKSA